MRTQRIHPVTGQTERPQRTCSLTCVKAEEPESEVDSRGFCVCE